ncbi:carbonic anhydrase 3-like isoform X2 [Manduca sexta]|uniref:carbonic anhydrase 3-like isoform X2 n=1 Tax=Manduca sexta TaxID=7130 RepID=UPI001181CA0F|nr:carbonic anhydrase 3-like isoform X2 [Manduca sexta]
MVADGKIRVFCILFFAQTLEYAELTQDQTTSRANTLYDDADDIQRQLDNEARDRMKYGFPKTVWVFHLPTTFPDMSWFHEMKTPRNSYLFGKRATSGVETVTPLLNQNKWSTLFPECAGRSQSPVNLPASGLVKARGARRLLFCNYNVPAKSMRVVRDSQSLTLYGKWNKVDRPLVCGGAAHSRRYLFHSLTLHWPSEHVIGGLQYPLESQALHISAEYKTFKDAVAAASRDKLAFLGIVNIYKFTNRTQQGLKSILKAATSKRPGNNYSIPAHSIGFFTPPFQEYVTYQGSLTYPPCTEAVLWFVRARSLPVERNIVKAAHKLTNPYNEPMKLLIRRLQPMNDRKTYFFG